jgi:hypothetical protein
MICYYTHHIHVIPIMMYASVHVAINVSIMHIIHHTTSFLSVACMSFACAIWVVHPPAIPSAGRFQSSLPGHIQVYRAAFHHRHESASCSTCIHVSRTLHAVRTLHCHHVDYLSRSSSTLLILGNSSTSCTQYANASSLDDSIHLT